jgi:hypothetical protein
MSLVKVSCLCTLLLLTGQCFACTIIKLVNEEAVLAGNNEDWNVTDTRTWFIPAGANRYGMVCVGFSDGLAQAGMDYPRWLGLGKRVR